jgi:hypothetical protein
MVCIQQTLTLFEIVDKEIFKFDLLITLNTTWIISTYM